MVSANEVGQAGIKNPPVFLADPLDIAKGRLASAVGKVPTSEGRDAKRASIRTSGIKPPPRLHLRWTEIGLWGIVTGYRSATVPDFHRIPCVSLQMVELGVSLVFIEVKALKPLSGACVRCGGDEKATNSSNALTIHLDW